MPRFLTLPLLLLLLAPHAKAAGEFYCCQDPTSGRRICGDSLPLQCRGQAYRILDSGGNVTKEVGPPLTPEQKAEQVAEARRRKQMEEEARELRRKDQALLDTYATPQDIDLAQGKAERDVMLAIRNAEASIEASRIKRQKFEAEAEFYKKKTMPAPLGKELRAIDHEIKVQQELIDVKKRELETIRAKYEADRKRYFELTGRAPDGTPLKRPASSSATR
ncbi:MAG: hypothetical protein F9K30_11680 [Dechloromonas sp.]|nr:MAG: hypothetical protein F9K30_11680 [Dechloromonas sp.]